MTKSVLADRAIDEVVSDPESDAEVELRAIDASKVRFYFLIFLIFGDF